MNEIIKLISVEFVKNARGFESLKETGQKNIYAQNLSVGISEFYNAELAGFKSLLKFKIYKIDYENEERVEYNGIKYNLIRVYNLENDFCEITVGKIEGKNG